MRLLILLLLMFLPLVIDAACVAVAGDEIRARDLAPADPVWNNLAPDTVLGFAPVAGMQRVVRPDTLHHWAARHGVTLTADGDICVERPMRAVAKEDFEAALGAALEKRGASGARFEVVEYSRYPAPPGPIAFPPTGLAEPPARQPDAPVLWRGYITYGAGRRFGVWVRARILVKQRQVAARNPIAVNQLITAGDVVVKEIETFPFARTPAPEPQQVVGKLARRSFAAGEPIIPRMLGQPYAVKRGEKVTVEVQTGSTQLAVEAVAERPGREGDLIPLKNPASGKTFLAVVSGAGKATIKTGGRM